jgi:hypothetical protein
VWSGAELVKQLDGYALAPCAGLEHWSDLVVIHQRPDRGSGVPEGRETSSIGTPWSDSIDTIECGSSRGVHAPGSIPGTSVSARRKSRRRCDPSMAVPTREVNTKPDSTHAEPAASRSRPAGRAADAVPATRPVFEAGLGDAGNAKRPDLPRRERSCR